MVEFKIVHSSKIASFLGQKMKDSVPDSELRKILL